MYIGHSCTRKQKHPNDITLKEEGAVITNKKEIAQIFNDYFVTIARGFWTLQIDVSFLCVCPLIDDKLRHNFVKVAVEPRDAGE